MGPSTRQDRTYGARGIGGMLLPCALLTAMPATAQTRAGTAIVNTAILHRDEASLASNVVTVLVAERLDVVLARGASDDPGVVAATLVNRGNGDEAFAVAAVVRGSATIGTPGVAVGGGAPVPLDDGRTPPIAPGGSATLLVPVSAAAADAVLTLSVRAVTGSGAAGTAFAGQGDGGADAVVGPTGAATSLTIALDPAAALAPSLFKSQTVLAPDGSATPVRGARIDYTLVARFAAATGEATIVDPIPAGTAYAPGSLTLDGAPLADAGHVVGDRLAVPLGAVAAGTTRTLRFAVVIS